MSTTLAAPLPLRERWRRRRDRWVADPAFREQASRWPGARSLARRQASELFDLMAGFVYSQILFACVKLRLFDRLAAAPASTQAVAAWGGLPLDATQRLLAAAEALELVRSADAAASMWALGRLGATLAGNPALDALIQHHAALYADLQDPLALLRRGRGGTQLAAMWSYATAPAPGDLRDDHVAPYSAVMTASQALIARQVIDAYPLHRHHCLLDVGGGEGAFLAAALQATPNLRGQLCDLPAVAERARARLAAAGHGDRAEVHGIDFKRGALPHGADLVSLVRVLYDHDDEPALALLSSVRQMLQERGGGTLLVAEPLAQAAGAERMGAAYFGIYLWAMGSGRVRSAAEHLALLRRAGFRDARERRTALPVQTGLLVARV